jgi:hypothetical protein
MHGGVPVVHHVMFLCCALGWEIFIKGYCQFTVVEPVCGGWLGVLGEDMASISHQNRTSRKHASIEAVVFLCNVKLTLRYASFQASCYGRSTTPKVPLVTSDSDQ